VTGVSQKDDINQVFTRPLSHDFSYQSSHGFIIVIKVCSASAYLSFKTLCTLTFE